MIATFKHFVFLWLKYTTNFPKIELEWCEALALALAMIEPFLRAVLCFYCCETQLGP